jgi:hypothetical protein
MASVASQILDRPDRRAGDTSQGVGTGPLSMSVMSGQTGDSLDRTWASKVTEYVSVSFA